MLKKDYTDAMHYFEFVRLLLKNYYRFFELELSQRDRIEYKRNSSGGLNFLKIIPSHMQTHMMRTLNFVYTKNKTSISKLLDKANRNETKTLTKFYLALPTFLRISFTYFVERSGT